VLSTKYSHLQDVALLHKIAHGDKGAFNEVYERYWKQMYQAGNKVLKDKDASMDVVQDIFVKFWENKETINVHTNLKGYLLVAVKFKVANYIRHHQVKETFFEKISQEPQPLNTASEQLEVKELKNYISQFTEALPEKCREIFVLSRKEYLSNKQIASQLGISVKTVENQITIALKRLKINLEKVSSLLFFFLF